MISVPQSLFRWAEGFLIALIKSKYFLNKVKSIPHNFILSIVMGTDVEVYFKSLRKTRKFQLHIKYKCISRYS